MKKFLFLIISVLVLAGGAFLAYEQLKPPSFDNTPTRFVILKGQTASGVAASLYSQGFIKNPIAFRIYATLTGKTTKIQAGEYEIGKNLTVPQILDAFQGGPSEVWVTVQEGIRREEIAQRFIDGLSLSGEVANEFRSEFLELTADKEGYLFPDTYLVPKDATVTLVVNLLTNTFKLKVGTVDKKHIILASILERETLGEAEKPIVAGILFKRAENNWPLQADATAQYARDTIKCKNNPSCKYWEPVTRDDLAINSPMNTYKFPGLPPAPIANPGLTTIQAALNPEDSPYWYYLHDLNGEIHYATTLDEHNANIAKYFR